MVKSAFLFTKYFLVLACFCVMLMLVLNTITLWLVYLSAVEDICHRYPRATEVNLCGNPEMHMLVMRAVSLLRYIFRHLHLKFVFGSNFSCS